MEKTKENMKQKKSSRFDKVAPNDIKWYTGDIKIAADYDQNIKLN